VSIEVHCPNPACARVHRVKNRWAGKRGTCPDCGAVIKVPDPSKALQAPPRPEEEATVAHEMPAEAMEFALPEYQQGEAEVVSEPGGEQANVILAQEVEEDADWDQDAITTGPAARAADLADEDEAPAPAGARFSWATALVYVLGVVSLLAVCAAPFLPGVSAEFTGPGAANLSARRQATFKEDKILFVIALPAAAAGLALAGLLAGLFRRRFSVPTLLLTYPAAILSLVILILATVAFRTIPESLAAEAQASIKTPGVQVTVKPGIDLYTAVAAAGAAALFLLIAVVLTLRRTWSRSIFIVLEVLLLSFGVLMHLVKA
jgi:hypothetical protein